MIYIYNLIIIFYYFNESFLFIDKIFNKMFLLNCLFLNILGNKLRTTEYRSCVRYRFMRKWGFIWNNFILHFRLIYSHLNSHFLAVCKHHRRTKHSIKQKLVTFRKIVTKSSAIALSATLIIFVCIGTSLFSPFDF